MSVLFSRRLFRLFFSSIGSGQFLILVVYKGLFALFSRAAPAWKSGGPASFKSGYRAIRLCRFSRSVLYLFAKRISFWKAAEKKADPSEGSEVPSGWISLLCLDRVLSFRIYERNGFASIFIERFFVPYFSLLSLSLESAFESSAFLSSDFLLSDFLVSGVSTLKM